MDQATKHHRKHHMSGRWLPSLSSCRRCQTAKSKCQIKKVYKSRELADKEALRQNISVNWWPDACKLAYHCMWCSKWHLTTACREWQTVRVDKMYRKWCRKIGRHDDGWNLREAS